MLTVMGKRKLIVVGSVVVLAALLIASTILTVRHFQSEKKKKAESSKVKTDIASQTKLVNDILAKEQKRIETAASKIKSVNDLKKLSVADQGLVGMFLIRKNIDSDKKLVKQYIDYLMLRNDSAGIEASIFCYKLAGTDTAAQTLCVNRANEQARSQGIIGKDGSLPDSYFKSKPEAEEQG